MNDAIWGFVLQAVDREHLGVSGVVLEEVSVNPVAVLVGATDIARAKETGIIVFTARWWRKCFFVPYAVTPQEWAIVFAILGCIFYKEPGDAETVAKKLPWLSESFFIPLPKIGA